MNNDEATPTPRGEQADRSALRAMVVDDSGLLAERLDRALRERAIVADVRVVEDYLMALGDAATQGPPDVIVGRPDPLEGQSWDADATVHALRRIAPDARLVLVLPDAQTTVAARNGFDARLTEPIDDVQLIEALQPMPSPSETIDHVQLDPDPQSTQSAQHETKPGLSEGPDQNAQGQQQPPEEAPAQSAVHPDATLIDSILNVTGDLREQAVRLATQLTGIPDLALVTDTDEPIDDATFTFADATCRGVKFGRLVAPRGANADDLNRAADWLAHWLALDRRIGQLWDMALHDDLTGAWNRRYFDRFLHNAIERAARSRQYVTVLAFDIDNFKAYNDQFGHDAGDDILRETVRLLQSVIRKEDVVARIGGDEFAVVFWDPQGPRQSDSSHPTDVKTAAHRFQAAIDAHRFPKLGDDAPGKLTISGGLATFPWDGRTPRELVRAADQAALESKRQGKNAITFGPGADRVCNGHAHDANEHSPPRPPV